MSTTALRAAVTGEKPEERKTIKDYLKDPRVQQGLKAVSGKFLTPDRMMSLMVNACDRNPALLKCTPRSLLGGMMLSHAYQLEPNTPQQLAFLIPYERSVKIDGQWERITEAQFQIGARGFKLLAHRSGYFTRLVARAVRENDIFEHMEGSDAFLKYQVSLKKERGLVIAAFSYVEWKTGAQEALVLPWSELEKIRAKSETYRTLFDKMHLATSPADKAKAEKKLADTPWVMWIDDMCAKSATKKHAKDWPIGGSDPLSTATTVDDAAEAGTIDLGAFADEDQTRAVVEGGDEPPLLEHDPSPTLEETVKPTDKVPVGQAGSKEQPKEGDQK